MNTVISLFIFMALAMIIAAAVPSLRKRFYTRNRVQVDELERFDRLTEILRGFKEPDRFWVTEYALNTLQSRTTFMSRLSIAYDETGMLVLEIGEMIGSIYLAISMAPEIVSVITIRGVDGVYFLLGGTFGIYMLYTIMNAFLVVLLGSGGVIAIISDMVIRREADHA